MGEPKCNSQHDLDGPYRRQSAVLTESGSLAQPIVGRQIRDGYRQYVETEAWSSLWGIVKCENTCIAKGVLDRYAQGCFV